MTDKSSYKNILKATSLFGSVQVVNIASTIIRGKIVAIFLGTVGMGISSLLLSSIAMLQSVAGLGLSFSAVREISKANETEDIFKLGKIVNVFFSWLIISAIFGAIILIVLAPFLSDFAFGNRNYTWEFVWLSIVVTLNTLAAGFQSLLQGTRRLKHLAASSVSSSLLSFLTSLPIYYFWGVKGIVPALIITALTTVTLNYFYAHKIKLTKVIIGIKEILKEGSEMVKLGVVMMLTSLLSTLTSFLIITYIKKNGSLSDVGLYQAGLSLTMTSIGLVFTAMGVDYFPRLSAISFDNIKVRKLANQQSEVMLLIVAPLIIALIIISPILIRILLTKEFLPLENFIRWILVGLLFQAANYSMGLISFAKGDRNTFFLLAIVGNCSLLLFSVLGYKLYKLNGVAAMFIVHSIICYFLVYITAYKKYKYSMNGSFIKILIVSTIIVTFECILLIVTPNVLGYTVCTLMLCISLVYSIYKIDKRIGLKEVYNNFAKQLKRK